MNEAAASIFKNNKSIDVLYVNKNLEFFTDKNSVEISVNGKKSDWARIERLSVLSEEETKDSKQAIENAKASENGLVLMADNSKELLFPDIKNEVREPEKGEKAVVDKKPANGDFLFNGNKLTFKDGALESIEYKDAAARSLFTK